MDTPAELEVKKVKKPRRKKRHANKTRMVTGYIIYASEIRKEVIQKYPDKDFGDISKLVGIEWKNLPTETKIAFEQRAQEQNKRNQIAFENQNLLLQQQQQQQQQNHEQEQPKEKSKSRRKSKIDVQVTESPTQQQPQDQGHTQPQPQQQPLQVIQQQRSDVVTVQYCSSNFEGSFPNQHQSLMPVRHIQSYLPPSKTNIVYRKPATVRLRPKDATTQTDTVKWIMRKPKKVLMFSEKFLNHLRERGNSPNV